MANNSKNNKNLLSKGITLRIANNSNNNNLLSKKITLGRANNSNKNNNNNNNSNNNLLSKKITLRMAVCNTLFPSIPEVSESNSLARPRVLQQDLRYEPLSITNEGERQIECLIPVCGHVLGHD